MRTRRSLCAAAAALLLAGVSLRPAAAQGPATTAPASVLTRENLPRMLTSLGYEPKDLDDGSWYVTTERTGYTVSVRFVLSGDGTQLWLSSRLGSVDPDRLPARVYRGLLSRNTGTARFYVCDCESCEKRVEKDLFISQPVANRFMTAAHVRAEMDDFCNNVVRLDKLWKPAVEAGRAASGTVNR